jgi:hypothetical protein
MWVVSGDGNARDVFWKTLCCICEVALVSGSVRGGPKKRGETRVVSFFILSADVPGTLLKNRGPFPPCDGI